LVAAQVPEPTDMDVELDAGAAVESTTTDHREVTACDW
jgi:hypothetical protein